MSGQSGFISGVIGGFGGFVMGILGNLVATYIQQDWMDNQFTTFGIGLLVGLTLAGIFVGAWWSSRTPPVSPQINTPKKKLKKVKNKRGSEIRIEVDDVHLEKVENDQNSKIIIK